MCLFGLLIKAYHRDLFWKGCIVWLSMLKDETVLCFHLLQTFRIMTRGSISVLWPSAHQPTQSHLSMEVTTAQQSQKRLSRYQISCIWVMLSLLLPCPTPHLPGDNCPPPPKFTSLKGIYLKISVHI